MSANQKKYLILQSFYSLVSIIFWLVAYFAHRTLDEKSDFGQKNAHFSSTFCMKKVGTLLDTSQSVVRFLLGFYSVRFISCKMNFRRQLYLKKLFKRKKCPFFQYFLYKNSGLSSGDSPSWSRQCQAHHSTTGRSQTRTAFFLYFLDGVFNPSKSTKSTRTMKLNGRVWTLYPLNSMRQVYIELGKIIVSKVHTNGRKTAGSISVVGI